MDYPYQFPVRIYWEDTDAGGVVYHSRYVNFLERARSEWLRVLGFSQTALGEELGGTFVVRNITISYRKPSRLDDQLLIHCACKSVRGTSILLDQLITRSDNAGSLTEVAQADVLLVWVRCKTFKPAAVPQPICAHFGSPASS